MSELYQSEMDVTISVPLVDRNGIGVTPTSLSYQVTDEMGTVLLDTTPIGVPAGGSVDVTVPGNLNVAAPGQIEGRAILLTMTLPQGEMVTSKVYLIESPIVLVVMENSIQTEAEAEITSHMMSNSLYGWMGATRENKNIAMRAAYEKIARMSFVEIGRPNDGVTESIFRNSSPALQRALKNAQVVEADNILSSDTIQDKQRQGIMSETIGESSMFFRVQPPIDTPLCKAAMNQLRGFVRRSVILGRG